VRTPAHLVQSCRNRHCPICQSLARAEWIEARHAELLDCEYFHVVFTVPEPVAVIATQNKSLVYAILFRAVAETLQTIAAGPRHLGAEIGFFAVLHTWGSTLVHHPHLHCVVPGGGLSPDGTRWIACRPGFFLPVRVLSRLFRRRFSDLPTTGVRTSVIFDSAARAPCWRMRRRSRATWRHRGDRVGRVRQTAVRRAAAGT
jgi:hypothetical protein